MADVPNRDAATLVAYETAIEAMPPITRMVFLLHRVDDLPYGEIGHRLSIGCDAVEGYIAEALSMIGAMLDGETPTRWKRAPVVTAEASLRQRYRVYCEDRLRVLGITDPVVWDDGGGDHQSVVRAMLAAMPSRVRDTFILHQVEQLTYPQVAQRMRTSQWIVRHRMLRAIRYVVRRPEAFERWLWRQSERSPSK